MPFSIRPYRRFSVCCPVTYRAGVYEGQGHVWNFSMNGWRLSGDVPLLIGQTCPSTVNLPNRPSLIVPTAILRWGRGQQYDLETLVVEKPTHRQLEQIITRLNQDSFDCIE